MAADQGAGFERYRRRTTWSCRSRPTENGRKRYLAGRGQMAAFAALPAATEPWTGTHSQRRPGLKVVSDLVSEQCTSFNPASTYSLA